MKKGKSRNKRKKTRSRLLWIAIAVIGIAAVISAVCVAGMLATKENAWKTPEELLVEYMDHIPKQEYEEMYAMLHIEASGNVSQEDFVTRNSAIYEGIEVQNIAVQIIAYDEEQMTVTYRKLSSGVLELYRRRLPDVFRCLVFRRIICSYIEWSRGTYRITGTAIG